MATLWCIGRNYKDHAAEMNSPVPQTPLVFLKSGNCLSQKSQITIPDFTRDLHHELELAVKLGPLLIPSEVALALDLTARDIQSDCKKQGLPWSMAKSFRDSCPISQWIPFDNMSWFEKLNFQLRVNQTLRQDGHVSDMIFNLEQLIEHLKKYFPVEPGDIILTGTPAGVAKLNSGDKLIASLQGLIDWELFVS